MRPSRVLRLGASVLLSLVLTAAIAPVAAAANPNDQATTPAAGATAATRSGVVDAFKDPAARHAPGSVAAPSLPGFTITGTVTLKEGGALSGGYVVAVLTTDPNTYYDADTLSNGTYTIVVPAGTYYVWFDDADGTHFNGYYGGTGGLPVKHDNAAAINVSANVSGINAQLQKEAPWSITIDASPTTAALGSNVTVTAWANQDVELTDFAITITTSQAGNGPWHCYELAGCYTDSQMLASPGSITYSAVVAWPDGTHVQAGSGSITVNWVIPATYHAIAPKRLLDTRDGTGGLSGAFTNHVARTFQVTGSDPTGVPTGATAVTGNLTVTGQTSNGYLFIGPDPVNNPTSSTLNFPRGDDRANAVTVALSATGSLSITFVAPTNGPTAHAIFDVTGYFTADGTGATYHAIPPARLLDTRDGTGGLNGPFTNHSGRTFQVTGGVVPAGARAVTGNLTVTGQTSNGYLFIGPELANNPTSSTLNFPPGDDRANAVTVALSASGTLSITFVAPNDGPTAHAIFDVTGYFTADNTGARYVALAPKRLLDTRDGTGGMGTNPFTNHAARTFMADAGVPGSAVAVTGNLTVTGQTSNGYLFVGPAATNNPTSSTLNFPKGDDRANAVTVAVGSTTVNSSVKATLSVTFVAPTNGPTAHGIFDVTGYFVPVVQN